MRNNAKSIVLQTKTALSEAYYSSNPEIMSQIKSQCDDDLIFLNELLKCCNNVLDQRALVAAIAEMNELRKIMEGKEVFLHSNRNLANEHMTSTSTTQTNIVCQDVNSAFENRIQNVVVTNKSHINPCQFLDDSCMVLKPRVDRVFKTEEVLKINAVLCCEFKLIKDEEEIYKRICTQSNAASIFKCDDFNIWYAKHIKKPIAAGMQTFEKQHGGWALSAVVHLKININKFTMLRGSSHIPLPHEILVKKACVNIQNRDNACFAWAVLSGLLLVKSRPYRVTSYPHYTERLNLNNITFPMTIDQIPRFELQNNVSINVFILKLNKEKNADKKFNIIPTYVSKHRADKHVNLLLIQSEYSDENNSRTARDDNGKVQPLRYHYVWIKNLSRLLSSQLNAKSAAKHICNRCLRFFCTSSKLERHKNDCSLERVYKIRVPSTKSKNVAFKNYMRKKKNPFIIYAGIESFDNTGQGYQKRVASNIGYYVKCMYDPTLSFYKSYRGENCITWLTSEFEQFADDVESVFICDVPKDKMTANEKKQFNNHKSLQLCYVCEEPIEDNSKKVQTNCRFTGVYKGPSHEICNMNFRDSRVIPVYFHNSSEYDSHLLIQSFQASFAGRIIINKIPNDESFITFTKYSDCRIKFRFMDFRQFADSTLSKLSSYLTVFPILRSEMPTLTDMQLELLTAQSAYPQEYFDGSLKFEETTLPPLEAFGDVATYKRAKLIWNIFGICNFGEYTDFCLKTKVLLLADVFEDFRFNCMEKYVLDPSHYLTLSAYSWDVMLRYTNISLNLLTDIDMVTFIERGTRCGLTQCSRRYSVANNKYLENYIPTEIPKYLMYFGLDNQCDWAMSQHLPFGHFEWVTDFNDFDVELIPDNSLIGYILEVDIEYPAYLYERHKDLPFLPEYQKATNSEEKLITTLNDKEKYVLHYRNLKQALEHGLKVTKIHRILQFEQSPWLKSYIDLNRSLSMSAKNDFERNLFALMNYAIFENSTEHFTDDCTVRLVTHWCGRFKAESCISKSDFKLSTIISEDMVAIESYSKEIYLNKPVYVGMCLLDLAKTRLYEFHYEYMKRKFEQNCSICYTDTDSLLYEITAIDVYESIREDCHHQFDTSNYPPDNIWNIPRVNAKALGLMKDRNNGRVLTEFVGLTSKMYAMRIDERHKPMRQRGIEKEMTARRITFADYMNSLVKKYV